MKLLVLGGDGMLGHQLMYSLSKDHEVKCTLRGSEEQYGGASIFRDSNAFFDTDIRDEVRIIETLGAFEPYAVINCVGIVKQRMESKESIPSIEINALAPHKIAGICKGRGIRFIHVSTDCVFDGKTGGYKESDPCNVSDIYGLTKYLGETQGPNSLTLRTSIIGHELRRKTGLLEWFLAQTEPVKGFKNAIFSGLTTFELANVINMLITQYRDVYGLYHVSSQPITKFDLLHLFNEVYERNISIEVDEEFFCNRSLDSSQFRTTCNYAPPEWDALIRSMKEDYDERCKEN